MNLFPNKKSFFIFLALVSLLFASLGVHKYCKNVEREIFHQLVYGIDFNQQKQILDQKVLQGEITQQEADEYFEKLQNRSQIDLDYFILRGRKYISSSNNSLDISPVTEFCFY